MYGSGSVRERPPGIWEPLCFRRSRPLDGAAPHADESVPRVESGCCEVLRATLATSNLSGFSYCRCASGHIASKQKSALHQVASTFPLSMIGLFSATGGLRNARTSGFIDGCVPPVARSSRSRGFSGSTTFFLRPRSRQCWRDLDLAKIIAVQ